MKNQLLTIILFTLSLFAFCSDYAPMQLGNFWVYDIIDTGTGAWIGIDSTVINGTIVKSPAMSPAQTIYYHETNNHFFSGKDSSGKMELFTYSLSPNNVCFYDPTFPPPYTKLLQHKNNQGDKWWTALDTARVNYIGTFSVPAGSFDSCYTIFTPDSTGYIVAPNVGVIQKYYQGKITRKLRKHGSVTLVSLKKNTFRPVIQLNNPVENTLMINTDRQINMIEWIDITGNIIHTIYGNEKNIYVSQIKAGLYFIRISYEGGITTKKIVKK